ncbi:HAD family hydrolase [Vibrio campbellii]
MIEKVLISSDFLSTKEKEQFSNVKWLFDLLKRPIKQVTGINPEIFTSSLVDSLRLSRVDFFNKSKIELNIHDVQYYFTSDGISKESLEYLSKFIDNKTLLIGYELSQSTKDILDSLNVTYVDVWLHPIRYMDDILLAFNSNNKEIKNNLSRFNHSEELYYTYATKCKISKYKGYKRKDINVEPNSALFIGQTLNDKAILKDGEMLNILHFQKEVDDIINKYNKVYYSRHPYVKSGDEEIIKYLKSKGILVTEIPAYDLLSSDNIRHVFSVSSSVVHEAKYFEKSTQFLFKPIFNLSTELGETNYASVMHSFAFSYFWADVLDPIMSTNKTFEAVDFSIKKDQMRDMLAFYWSYKHVDKIEMMRSQLNAVDYKLQRAINAHSEGKKEVGNVSVDLKKERLSKAKNLNPRKHISIDNALLSLKSVRTSIKKHDVISFDIFDTLLVRPYNNPNYLFDIMTPFVKEITDGKINDFKSARLDARKFVSKDDYNGEEVNLLERYSAIGEQYGLSSDVVRKMYEKELEVEISTLRKREDGFKIFSLAKELGKKVILVSDIFYRENFIRELLDKNGITDFDELFLSSEVGKLKHSGSLFKHVLETVDVQPEKMYHIGDNKHSDVIQATVNGVHALHLPQTHERYLSTSPLSSVCKNNWINGLVANKYYQCYEDNYANSFTNGSIKQFGYSIFGPMLYGFAKWINDKKKADNVDELLFLARDGEIVKKAYETIYGEECKYLLASRRSLSVASLRTEEDVLNLVDINFSPTSLDGFILKRWGYKLTEQDRNIILLAGFEKADQIVRQEEKAKIKVLLKGIADNVLANASIERAQLLNSYKDQGALNNKKSAIVDIGHHGTLQKYLSNLLEKNLSGYYFATFSKIDELDKLGLENSGYVLDRHDVKIRHDYVSNILMFEILFLNQSGSFVRYKDGHPEFLSLKGEESRLLFSKELHEGALEFVKDYAEIDKQGFDSEIDIDNAIKSYMSFIENPSLCDARIFQGVVFENDYSARKLRYLVPPIKGRCCSDPVWKQGEKKLFVDTPKIYRSINFKSFKIWYFGYSCSRSVHQKISKGF